MGHQDALPRDEMIDFVMSCWDEETGRFKPSPQGVMWVELDPQGAFGAHPDHDGHILGTLSAIQILITQDAFDRINVERVTNCELI